MDNINYNDIIDQKIGGFILPAEDKMAVQNKDPHIAARCLELALKKCDMMQIENGQVYKMADDFYNYVTKPVPNGQTKPGQCGPTHIRVY